jgi:protein tyrosine phosphatase
MISTTAVSSSPSAAAAAAAITSTPLSSAVDLDAEFKQIRREVDLAYRSMREYHYKSGYKNNEDAKSDPLARHNLHTDIYPVEISRVTMEDEDFYFNANTLFGSSAIASQWPMRHEIPDFLRMIVQSNVKVLVTLADPLEPPEVFTGPYKEFYPYWREYLWYGKASVSNVTEALVYNNEGIKIVKREMTVTYLKQTQHVTQFHLQNWPDKQTIDPKHLAELIRLVNVSHDRTSPVLAHCTAGVFSTGAFLAAWQSHKKGQTSIKETAKELCHPHFGRNEHMMNRIDYYKMAQQTLDLLIGASPTTRV